MNQSQTAVGLIAIATAERERGQKYYDATDEDSYVTRTELRSDIQRCNLAIKAAAAGRLQEAISLCVGFASAGIRNQELSKVTGVLTTSDGRAFLPSEVVVREIEAEFEKERKSERASNEKEAREAAEFQKNKPTYEAALKAFESKHRIEGLDPASKDSLLTPEEQEQYEALIHPFQLEDERISRSVFNDNEEWDARMRDESLLVGWYYVGSGRLNISSCDVIWGSMEIRRSLLNSDEPSDKVEFQLFTKEYDVGNDEEGPSVNKAVIESGEFSTVSEAVTYGYQRFGLTPGPAIDEKKKDTETGGMEPDI